MEVHDAQEPNQSDSKQPRGAVNAREEAARALLDFLHSDKSMRELLHKEKLTLRSMRECKNGEFRVIVQIAPDDAVHCVCQQTDGYAHPSTKTYFVMNTTKRMGFFVCAHPACKKSPIWGARYCGAKQ